MEIPTGERDHSAAESREQSGHEIKQQANVTGMFLLAHITLGHVSALPSVSADLCFYF